MPESDNNLLTPGEFRICVPHTRTMLDELNVFSWHIVFA